MTYTRREEILSKDILTIADVQELNEMSYWSAAELIRDIKRTACRVDKAGKVATQDYLDYFQLPRQTEPEEPRNPQLQQVLRIKNYIKEGKNDVKQPL